VTSSNTRPICDEFITLQINLMEVNAPPLFVAQ
jgi:hypothetical protein